MDRITVFFYLSALLISGSFADVTPDQPQTGFWAIEGTLVTHYFEETTDSLSGPELFELQDGDGLPIWFGRHIFKDVCISGECKMIRLWLFWNGAGNYLGIQVPEQEPLTKSDHTEFEPEDYVKLNNILRDTASILKTLKQDDLIIVPDSIDPYEVDGYTAATQPTLAEVVVKDAVYTCHTLWHTVYGPVQQSIFEILENRMDEEYLASMFNSPKPAYQSWAISSVRNFPEYHGTFHQHITDIIKSENTALANQALNYFNPELLTDAGIQEQLVKMMPVVEMDMRYEILWKFIRLGEVDENVVLELLNLYKEKSLVVGMLNLIFRLVTEEHLVENKEIYQIINNFADDENRYVRNLSQKLLNKKNVPVSN